MLSIVQLIERRRHVRGPDASDQRPHVQQVLRREPSAWDSLGEFLRGSGPRSRCLAQRKRTPEAGSRCLERGDRRCGWRPLALRRVRRVDNRGRPLLTRAYWSGRVAGQSDDANRGPLARWRKLPPARTRSSPSWNAARGHGDIGGYSPAGPRERERRECVRARRQRAPRGRALAGSAPDAVGTHAALPLHVSMAARDPGQANRAATPLELS